uniref:Uncharacterized protein n=1 Tax=Glossina austeni TaxID=7395 RepID=A0A1A9VWL0_GLOAU
MIVVVVVAINKYCVEFEVLKSSKTCHKLPPYNLMIEGDRITVRCDLEAFVYDNSRTNSIKNDTTRKSQTHLGTNLEFMQNSQQQNLDDDNESLEENDEEEDDENMIDGSSSDQEQQQDDYDSLTLKRKIRTTTSTTTTTTTTIAPALVNTPPNYHCRGEGLPGRTTRWSALAAPSCRGKWLRLTLRTPKKCTHAQFIYV